MTATAAEIHAAVDAFVGAYNDSRSERRGYRYVSGYLLTSDPDLGEAVRVLLAPLYREVAELTEHSGRFRSERDRYREDSQTLNTITWAIAGALGDIPPGADSVEADPVELAQRLIGTLERRTVQRDNARADADTAHAEVERLTAKLSDAQDRPWQNT